MSFRKHAFGGLVTASILGILAAGIAGAHEEPLQRGSKTLTVLHHDDFDCGSNLAGWQSISGSWSANPWGRLEASQTTGSQMITLDHSLPRSFELEITMSLKEGVGWAGVQIRKDAPAAPPWQANGDGGYLIFLTDAGELYIKYGPAPGDVHLAADDVDMSLAFAWLRIIADGGELIVEYNYSGLEGRYTGRTVLVDREYQGRHLSLMTLDRRAFFDFFFATRGQDRVWFTPGVRDQLGSILVNGVRSDYVTQVSDPATYWPNLLAQTDVLRTQINVFAALSDQELETLRSGLSDEPLDLAVEFGGLGINDTLYCGAGAGELWATNDELPKLRRWTGEENELAEIDFLSADNPITNNYLNWANGVTSCQMDRDEMLQEFIDALLIHHAAFPEARLGLIDSIGAFDILDENGQILYPSRCVACPASGGVKWDFRQYLEDVIEAFEAAGLELDHYHVDFGGHGVIQDGGPSGRDYGRVLAVEQIVQSLGISFGVQINPGKDGNQPGCTNAAALLEMTTYASDYVAAGGDPDHVLVGGLPHLCPDATGPESIPETATGAALTTLPILIP